jgi:molecular chaperone DnaK
MTKMINFGIDLGTSNSLVAKFDKGNVEIFKNPNGFKETLPSVVGFRNDRTLVGEQAKTFAERDPKSVASRFKRKMGTSETLQIKGIKASKTPVELSAYVLKELKSFVHTGESLEAAVITIPASFDTVQSNATREAGILAGFKTVVLLQEPIAASLAYANKERTVDLKNSQWMVYDLGGGTFDVALVRIVEGELTVVDHEGDNYLGGTDFDALLVEKLLVPELERRGDFKDLLAEMKSESGKYNRLWHSLVHKAEEAKIELSTKTSAEVDLGSVRDLTDDQGKVVDSIITISRSDLDAVLRDAVDGTTDMMKKILVRNALQPQDLQFILMVGGSTYIPYVRKRVEEVMGIRVNTSIDPTNAIAVGAAYFAGTKELRNNEMVDTQPVRAGAVKIRAAYNRNSQEKEETFTAKVEGDTAGMHYRIVSSDGAFDSGLKKLAGRIVEDLPLREGAFNIFSLKIVDGQGNSVGHDFDSIQIAQGRYSVAGQMLPEDISLVKDDVAARDTRLEVLFSKNAVLPTKAKKTVEVGKTIIKGSADELRIMVVEGPVERHSSTNKPIGVLFITGSQISRDVFKGTEIDLTVEMSESRELTVSAFVNGTGQEFSQVFKSSARTVTAPMLAKEILLLESKVQDELGDAEKSGNVEAAQSLSRLLEPVQDLMGEAAKLADDDITDDKFKLEDQKRRLAQNLYDLTSGKRIDQARAAYGEAKAETAQLVRDSGNDRERHLVTEIMAREQTFIHSTNPEKINAMTAALKSIQWGILARTPDFLVNMFKVLVERRTGMNDQLQVGTLIEQGKSSIESMNWDSLRQINGRLWDLMPAVEQASEEMQSYTGIV